MIHRRYPCAWIVIRNLLILSPIYFALLLLTTACTDPVQADVKIVDVYRTGFGLRQTRTVVEMPDGTRRELEGRRGREGETIKLWIRGNDISVRNDR